MDDIDKLSLYDNHPSDFQNKQQQKAEDWAGYHALVSWANQPPGRIIIFGLPVCIWK